MIQAKVDRVCYNLASNLNKFKRLLTSTRGTEISRGEAGGVKYYEVPPFDWDIEETREEEKPLVIVQP